MKTFFLFLYILNVKFLVIYLVRKTTSAKIYTKVSDTNNFHMAELMGSQSTI